MESWLKKGILSHKLSSLKYIMKCKKIIDGCYRLFCSLLFMLVLACLPVYLAFSQTVPVTAGVKYLVWNRITLMLGTLRFSCQAVNNLEYSKLARMLQRYPGRLNDPMIPMIVKRRATAYWVFA
jgi:hypothetical protein